MLITLGTFVLEKTITCHNCGANQTVTAKLNGIVMATETSDANGDVVLKVYDEGTFTIETPYQSQSKQVVVSNESETYEIYFRYYIYIYGQSGLVHGGQIRTITRTSDSTGAPGTTGFNCGGQSTIGDHYSCFTTEKIDVTNYSTVCFDCAGSTWGGGGGSNHCGLNSNMSYSEVNVRSVGVGGRKTYRVNVSDLTGSYYLQIHAFANGIGGTGNIGGASITCYNLWLE